MVISVIIMAPHLVAAVSPLTDGSIHYLLRTASYDPLGNSKLIFMSTGRAPESNASLRGANSRQQLDTTSPFPPKVGSNTGRVEINRRWPRDEQGYHAVAGLQRLR